MMRPMRVQKARSVYVCARRMNLNALLCLGGRAFGKDAQTTPPKLQCHAFYTIDHLLPSAARASAADDADVVIVNPAFSRIGAGVLVLETFALLLCAI